jgi:hypothetical protein
MWQVALLGLLAASPGAAAGRTANGQAYGPRLTMTCRWFSNFENSRLETCRANGRNLLGSEGASIEFEGRTGRQLDAEARRIAHWREPDPVWGSFVLRIVGRVAVSRHTPRYLRDGTRTVLLEKLLSIAKAP